MEEKRLADKIIVISGGTKGVGRAAAEEFARQGAKVVIGGRDKEAALRSLRLIKTYGSKGIFVHTDLEKVDDCKKLWRHRGRNVSLSRDICNVMIWESIIHSRMVNAVPPVYMTDTQQMNSRD